MNRLTVADLTPDLNDDVPRDDAAEPADAGLGEHDGKGQA